MHLWKVRDMAHFEAGLASFAHDRDGRKIFGELGACVEEETLTLGDTLSYVANAPSK